MADIVKNLSNLIKDQFPDFYREEGDQLVAFVEAYYEFLEETYGYSEYMNRRLFENNDIDTTLDDFLVYFKSKYISEFPYVTTVDKRFMIKHIMDFYRSKGSEKSVKLLLKLLFGEEGNVYYPAKDILKPSTSKWVIPNYVEVTNTPRSIEMVGKQVIGSLSKATAIVDAVVTKRSGGKLIDVMFLSKVSKNFVKNDQITEDGSLLNAPVVLGSLSSVNITQGAVNYEVGEVVDIAGTTGTRAKGIVSTIINPTDKVTLNLLDGGFGYTTDGYTQVYISEDKLRIVESIANVKTFAQVFQYKFEAEHQSNTVSSYVGDGIEIFDSSNNNVGSGIVLSATDEDASNGTIEIQWTSNTDLSTVISTIDYIEGPSSSYTLSIISPTDTSVEAFVVGKAGVGVGVAYTNSETFSSGVSDGIMVYEDGTEYTIAEIEGGSGFDFDIGSITDTEVVSINTDLLTQIDLTATLDGANVFPSDTDVTANLDVALAYDSLTLGRIDSLINFNPGAGYQSSPFAVIINPYVSSSYIQDDIILVELDDTFAIRVGDEIKNGSTVATVKSVSFPEQGFARIFIRNRTYASQLENGDTVAFHGYGEVLSKGTGTIASTSLDQTSKAMGSNAVISSEVFSATGTIETLEIIDSGLGYFTGEIVSIKSSIDNQKPVGYGNAVAQTNGIGSGYWETTSSHLNSDKKIRDNYYYQEYSYEIQSGVSLERYRDIVKNTVHIAGTELFGRVINNSVSNPTNASITSSLEKIT